MVTTAPSPATLPDTTSRPIPGAPGRLVCVVPRCDCFGERPGEFLIEVRDAEGCWLSSSVWLERDGDPWSAVARWAARGAL